MFTHFSLYLSISIPHLKIAKTSYVFQHMRQRYLSFTSHLGHTRLLPSCSRKRVRDSLLFGWVSYFSIPHHEMRRCSFSPPFDTLCPSILHPVPSPFFVALHLHYPKSFQTNMAHAKIFKEGLFIMATQLLYYFFCLIFLSSSSLPLHWPSITIEMCVILTLAPSGYLGEEPPL